MDILKRSAELHFFLANRKNFVRVYLSIGVISMNVITIVVILLIVLCGWRGFRRGLFRSVLVAGALILSMVLSHFATPYVSRFLTEQTDIDDRIEAYIITTLELKVEQAAASRAEEMSVIEKLQIPEKLKDKMSTDNNSVIYQQLDITGFYEYIARYLTNIVMNSLAFIVIQVALTLSLWILLFTSDYMKEIPILNGLDKTGGLLLGLLQALAIIWCAFVFAALIGNTELGMKIYAQIIESPILTFLYDHNLLLKTITGVIGG